MRKLDLASASRILVADDQEDVREALYLLFKGEGYKTEVVNSPAQVLEALKQKEFALLLMDLNYARDTTSGQEGLDLLGALEATALLSKVMAEIEVAVFTFDDQRIDYSGGLPKLRATNARPASN